MGLFNKKKNENSISPFDMDWGEVSPDAYNEKSNESTYICSHNYLSEESIKYSQILATGRVLWYQQYLPPFPKNRVSIDIRGQDEIADSLKRRKEVVQALKDKILAADDSIDIYVYTLG